MLSHLNLSATILLVLNLLAPKIALSKASDVKKDYSTQKLPDLPYFDLTDAINQKNVSEIEKALKISPNIYYSTDQLVSRILDLSWTAEFLSFFENHQESICLMISYKMTKNQDKINFQYIQDLLYSSSVSVQESLHDKLFKKYLCKIALDFQVYDYHGQVSEDYRHYARKWDLSFTRNAKQILQDVLVSESANYTVPKIGVIYNELQIGNDQLLLEQELCYADFLIVNVTYVPMARISPNYNIFQEELKQIHLKNQKFLKSLHQKHTTIVNHTGTKFMLTWVPVNDLPDLNPGEKEVFEKEATYLDIFQTFTGKLMEYQSFPVDIISGTVFNPSNFSMRWINETHMDQMIPYLYVHSVNTTRCQLETMVQKIATRFDDLVVNEFTWSTLARFNRRNLSEMKNDCVNLNINPTKYILKTILVATQNLGDALNQTVKSLAKLVQNNQQIGNLNLDTVVFRQNEEIKDNEGLTFFQRNHENFYKDSLWEQELQDLVHNWLQTNNSNKIGCLVEFSSEDRYRRNDAYEEIQKRCKPIFKQASVLIIQYELNSISKMTNNFTEFNPTVYGDGMLMKNVMNLFAMQRYLKSRYVFKRIIIQITTKNEYGNSPDTLSKVHCIKYLHYEWVVLRTLYRWAEIHDVELITKAAFDLRLPALGYWKPPQSNGGSAKYHAFCDYYK